MSTPTPASSPGPEQTSNGLPISVLVIVLCATVTLCEVVAIICACSQRRRLHRSRNSSFDGEPLPLPPDFTRSGLGAKLERYAFGEGGEVTCAVCLENCKGGERVCKLPCEHLFHDACVRGWLCKSVICPICRVNVYKQEGGGVMPSAAASSSTPGRNRRFVEL